MIDSKNNIKSFFSACLYKSSCSSVYVLHNMTVLVLYINPNLGFDSYNCFDNLISILIPLPCVYWWYNNYPYTLALCLLMIWYLSLYPCPVFTVDMIYILIPLPCVYWWYDIYPYILGLCSLTHDLYICMFCSLVSKTTMGIKMELSKYFLNISILFSILHYLLGKKESDWVL